MSVLTSRYDIGDKVWHVRKFNARCAHPCALCEGTGRVPIAADASKTATCPDCHGRRFSSTDFEYDETRATVRQLTLGQIDVRATEAGSEVRYMSSETGIGSGAIYMERDLYSSREDAMAACADAAMVFDEHGRLVTS